MAARAVAASAATSGVRLGVQPRHPQPTAPRDRRRPGVDRPASLPVAALEDPAVMRPRSRLRRTLAGSPPRPPPSGASAPCSTTRSATPSSSGSGRQPGRPHPMESPRVAEDRRPPRSRRPAQAAPCSRGSAPATPGSTWRRSTAACTTPPCARRRPSAPRSRLPLPARGWGRIDLAASAARAGRDWTDDGTARQARGLKHRADHETRSIPIPPVLVVLRAHLKRYGTAPDGRLFQHRPGGLIQDSA